MNEITNNELLKKLEKLISTNTEEIKQEIKEISDTLNGKIQKLEEKRLDLESKPTNLERKNRQNNIVISGLPKTTGGLLESTLSKINELLGTHFNEQQISNINTIGKNNTIVLEFISYLNKIQVFENIKNLKGSGIVIRHDLSKEDQAKRAIFYQRLKYARNTNIPSYIKNHKLYINHVPYEAEKLENLSIFDKQEDRFTPKASSAPPTPVIRRNNSDKDEGIETVSAATVQNTLTNRDQAIRNNIAETVQKPTGATRKKSYSNLKSTDERTSKSDTENKIKETLNITKPIESITCKYYN